MLWNVWEHASNQINPMSPRKCSDSCKVISITLCSKLHQWMWNSYISMTFWDPCYAPNKIFVLILMAGWLVEWFFVCNQITFGSWQDCGICIVNTLRPRQNGRHFADDIFKCIFLNSGLAGPWNRGIIAHQTPHFRRPPKHVNNKGPLVFAQTFCTAWFISLENLHIYFKTYVFSNTFEGFRPKCTFRGCLSKYRRTFIVYMFRRPPEVWSLMSDNALISGTGKVGMKMCEFRLRFHWSLFVRFRLTIFQHWFR